MMQVPRQTGIGKVDTPAIEELADGRNSDEHCRVTVLGNTDGHGLLRSSSRHVSSFRQPRDATRSGPDQVRAKKCVSRKFVTK